MRINLGCGNDYMPGWLNIDSSAAANPDLVFDLNKTPWPLETDCADHVLLKHVLEHLGQDTPTFMSILSELYRIMKPGGTIEIHVPHPLHSDFMGDPTHVRPITPEIFNCFDLALVERWQASKLPGTPLAKYVGIDFETTNVQFFLDPYWQDLQARGLIEHSELMLKARSNYNVIQWTRIDLRARKPFRHGRSLDHLGAVCLERRSGIGDVLMAFGAAKALKEMTGKPIYLLTQPRLKEIGEACPHFDGVLSEESEYEALCQEYAERGGVHRANMNKVGFAIGGRHQIDAYLGHFGLTADSAQKQIEINLDAAGADPILSTLPPPSPGKKRVLVHPSRGEPNRTWAAENWGDLTLRLIEQGHQVILIGATSPNKSTGTHPLEIPGAISVTDQLSALDTVRLMAASDVLVSTDSGPVQLAGATDIHILGIYSVVAGKCRLPYRHGEPAWNSTAVAPSCPHSPCYHWFLDQETVSRVNPSNTDRLFADWCMAEEKYHCMSKTITVDQVFDAFQRIA